jgi:hypothetical protein
MALFKQTDTRWKNEKLGFGSTTIGQAGCVICDLGELHFRLTGEDLNPSQVNARLKSVKAFKGDLVIWGMVEKTFPELKFVYRDGNYNNFNVWRWINIFPRVPVLVQALANSTSGYHWRLFIGGGKCYNSLTGIIESTSVYSKLTGSARYTRK